GLRFPGYVCAPGAQLGEHRIQVAGPEVEHRLLGGGPEVAGPGLEGREHRRAVALLPHAVLVGVQPQAVPVPGAQGRRVRGPQEVPTDPKNSFHAAILPGRRCWEGLVVTPEAEMVAALAGEAEVAAFVRENLLGGG